MKVTVAIPFYNNEDTLEFAIKSVINQTYTDWLLLLINDGSTDSSMEIAKKYLSEKVKLIDDGLNKGLIYRLNQAIDMTETPYFARMDSDDIMLPERLEKQVNYLENHQDIDLVGSSAFIIDECNNIVSVRRTSNKKRYNISDLIKHGLFIHPTVVGKTEWFLKNKYNSYFNRAEDLELWCRTFQTMSYYKIEEPLLFYRDPLQIDLKKYEATSKTNREIIKKYVTGSERFKLLTREIFKIQSYKLLFKLNGLKIIYKRRNPSIDQLDLEYAKEKLLQAVK